MPQAELQTFIGAAKQRGAGDDFLASLLVHRGWPAGDVYAALAEWWERDTGVMVPMRRRGVENARDAFLYLLAFSTLATWAFALGSLCFRLIERWLPDAAVGPYVYNFRATVTWQIASILVALPIYLFLMRVILRETRMNPDRIDSGVRKWLTYLALLLAAIGVVSDLVCFVDYFLRGELTVRFVLKCITVLAICGSVFRYYFGFLHGRASGRVFGVLAVAGATAAVCLGLGAAGMPHLQRRIESDNRRVQDLRTLAGALSSGASLPRTLAEFGASRPDLRLTDPETNQPYEYRQKTATEYELCAIFAAASEPTGGFYGSGFWSHSKGHACFALDRTRGVRW
jgi:Domain of unknown function (DUF5671)